MSFAISTDTASNLNKAMTDKYNLTLIPLTFFVNGMECRCNDLSNFDADGFFRNLKHLNVKTSTADAGKYIEAWTPILESGSDILHLSISSGLSSAFGIACTVAEKLRKEWPGRKIFVFDTLAASLGEGLQVLNACRLRDSGKDIRSCIRFILEKRDKTRQLFSVKSFHFLKKAGLFSSFTAQVGSFFRVKPILTSNYLGEIVVSGRAHSRIRVLKQLAASFSKTFDRKSSDPVGIAYAGCREEANRLIALLKKIAPKAEFLLSAYEPVTGSHVGPGALALFYTAS